MKTKIKSVTVIGNNFLRSLFGFKKKTGRSWVIDRPCYKCGAERGKDGKYLTPCPCCGDNVPF